MCDCSVAPVGKCDGGVASTTRSHRRRGNEGETSRRAEEEFDRSRIGEEVRALSGRAGRTEESLKDGAQGWFSHLLRSWHVGELSRSRPRRPCRLLPLDRRNRCEYDVNSVHVIFHFPEFVVVKLLKFLFFASKFEFKINMTRFG